MSSNQQNITSETRTRARMLRKNATLAEKRLWEVLRRSNTGLKFRRQSPIGRYIADFVCFEARIIVELDGYSHENAGEYDQARTRWFHDREYLTIRYTNDEVMTNLEGVREAIILVCEARTS